MITAEVTGLVSAMNHAEAMAKTYENYAAMGDTFVAGLAAGEVSGEAVAAAQRAREAEQLAATHWTTCQQALAQQLTVKDAYTATPGAGSKQFLTETGHAAPPGKQTSTQEQPTMNPDRPQPAPSPAADHSDGETPAPPPTPPAPPAPPMVRVTYSVIETVSGNWRSVGTIDVAAPLAYGDHMTLVAGLTRELRRRGQLPSGTHITVSPQHPDRPPMGWVHYKIMNGFRAIGEGTIEVNLAKAPTSDVALAATLTAVLRGQGEIAHDWHVKVLKRIS